MKPTNNPYQPAPLDFPFSPEEAGSSLAGIRTALNHELEDFVNLELTAEQMIGDEIQLVKAYVDDDAHHFWQDLKEGFTQWEIAAGQWLLTAADPTRVEWQKEHWWGDDEAHLH